MSVEMQNLFCGSALESVWLLKILATETTFPHHPGAPNLCLVIFGEGLRIERFFVHGKEVHTQVGFLSSAPLGNSLVATGCSNLQM